MERAVGRQATTIAEPKADLEERNAKLAVLEAECRLRNGRGENGSGEAVAMPREVSTYTRRH